MNLTKQLTVVGGIAALVALSYLGFGAANRDNAAQAQTDKAASKWTTSTPVDLTTDKAKLGYTIGSQIGQDLLRGEMEGEIDVDALVAALRDIQHDQDLRMSSEEMVAAQQAFQLKRQQEYAALANQNKVAGESFMEKTKSEEGIKITESGLQYEVVREGKGVTPQANDTEKVHYIGSLIDGTPFDSSYQRNQPADFPVTGVIPGFSEGLQLMKEGAKYRFVIPAELAYGERAPESIGPNQVLIFEVELLEVLNKEVEPASE
jgi:FKBP-type peptidyl-prolyl cis-trans isomerase